MSDAERKLWHALRARQIEGARFRRQHPIGRYVVDFVCLERRLVVEVDGGQHTEDDQVAHDVRRDRWLEAEAEPANVKCVVVVAIMLSILILYLGNSTLNLISPRYRVPRWNE